VEILHELLNLIIKLLNNNNNNKTTIRKAQ